MNNLFCKYQYSKLTDNKTQFITIMSRKITSPPSIQESLDFATKDQYIANLKVQCRMREEALRTAQSLIQAYQKQNQSLRDEIKTLKVVLEQTEQKLKQQQSQQETIKKLQKSIFKYSQKVNELLEKNVLAERTIRNLENQLHMRISQEKNQREYIRERLNKQKQNEKQKKELQSQFHNFLKMPPRESSIEDSPKYQKYSPGKQSFATASTKGESKRVDNNIKVLEWKLKQKDEEVMILLKRMNDLEQRTRKAEIQARRQKILTQDSLENFSSQKAYNISQFTQ